jgi:hypothetical protein
MLTADRHCFVSKEVDLLVFGQQVAKTVGFVPTGRENVNADLATDGEAGEGEINFYRAF